MLQRFIPQADFQRIVSMFADGFNRDTLKTAFPSPGLFWSACFMFIPTKICFQGLTKDPRVPELILLKLELADVGVEPRFLDGITAEKRGFLDSKSKAGEPATNL